MRLLISSARSKFWHNKEFESELCRQGHTARTILAEDVYGWPISKNPSKVLQTKKHLMSIIQEFDPDAVFDDGQSRLAVAASKEYGIPILGHLRGDYWQELEWDREEWNKGRILKSAHFWYKEKVANDWFERAAMILPICNYLKDIVNKHYPNKSRVFYQGIDPSKWRKTEGMDLQHPCVGMVQSANVLGKTKELLTLPRIMKRLPNVKFYWAGDGPHAAKVLPELRKYDNFEWLGSLEYPDSVRDFLSEIDVFMLMTGIDMSPLSLLEAQLMGKPVVATSVCGVPEIMRDGETGYLAGRGADQEWSSKLFELLNNKDQQVRMGQAGRRFVKDTFGWSKITSDFISTIQSIR